MPQVTSNDSIFVELDRLGGEAKELREAVDQLFNRLAPILRENPTVKNEGRSSPPVNSSVGSSIREVYEILTHAHDMVDELLVRIDLP